MDSRHFQHHVSFVPVNVSQGFVEKGAWQKLHKHLRLNSKILFFTNKLVSKDQSVQTEEWRLCPTLGTILLQWGRGHSWTDTKRILHDSSIVLIQEKEISSETMKNKLNSLFTVICLRRRSILGSDWLTK